MSPRISGHLLIVRIVSALSLVLGLACVNSALADWKEAVYAGLSALPADISTVTEDRHRSKACGAYNTLENRQRGEALLSSQLVYGSYSAVAFKEWDKTWTLDPFSNFNWQQKKWSAGTFSNILFG